MARKSGFEALEADEFVDEVEDSFAQLIEENQNLKKQVEALKATAPAAGQQSKTPAGQPADSGDDERQPGSGAVAAPPMPIVVTTAKDASPAVVRLVELSTE